MDGGNRYRAHTVWGWAITLLGCALWIYGYFITGSTSFLNWPSFAPSWIADTLTNWQSELGMLLTLVGSVPIYYAQFKTMRLPE